MREVHHQSTDHYWITYEEEEEETSPYSPWEDSSTSETPEPPKKPTLDALLTDSQQQKPVSQSKKPTESGNAQPLYVPKEDI
jgi:hypothetical protein